MNFIVSWVLELFKKPEFTVAVEPTPVPEKPKAKKKAVKKVATKKKPTVKKSKKVK